MADPADAGDVFAVTDDERRAAREHAAHMVSLVEGNPALADINAEEADLAAIRAQVLAPWAAAWRQGRTAGIAGVDQGAGLDWNGGLADAASHQGIDQHPWAPAATDDAGAATSAYLQSLARVEQVDLALLDARPSADGYRLTVHLDLRGVDRASDQRRQDRGRLLVDVARQGDTWQVRSVQPDALERLQATRSPVFSDVTADVGLASIAGETRIEAIRRGGYALAVGDLDEDQDPDLVIGRYGRLVVARNDGGSFVDVTEESGIGSETRVKSAALADLDEDGDRDLLVVRFVEMGAHNDGDVIAFENLGDGRFERRGNVLPRARTYDRAMPTALADFDGDGRLDVYVGFPGARDFTNDLASRPDSAYTGQGLWLNRGDWTFEEATNAELGNPAAAVYSHSALASDLDHDGDTDLIVMDDSGRISPVYVNQGGGEMVLTDRVGPRVAGFAMSAASGDLDGDGQVEVVTTQVGADDGRRLAARWGGSAADPGVAETFGHMDGLFKSSAFWTRNEAGDWVEASYDLGLGRAGQAPAGVALLDYDLDGDLDVYVVNGLWSGGDQDVTSWFVRTTLAQHDRFASDVAAAMNPPVDERPNPMLTMLRGFRGDLADPTGGERSDDPTLSFIGAERNALYRNDGQGRFTEVGWLEGVDLVEDGYVMANADIDGDGRMDIVVRNADPAPGHDWPTVRVLRNTNPLGSGLIVQLRGEGSNRDGIGAVVTARIGDHVQQREIQSATGAVQAWPAAIFGLGGQDQVQSIDVRWPDGTVETFGPLEAGVVEVTQGKGIVRLASR